MIFYPANFFCFVLFWLAWFISLYCDFTCCCHLTSDSLQSSSGTKLFIFAPDGANRDSGDRLRRRVPKARSQCLYTILYHGDSGHDILHLWYPHDNSGSSHYTIVFVIFIFIFNTFTFNFHPTTFL